MLPAGCTGAEAPMETGKFEDQVLSACLAVFKQYDTDNDGVLSQAESGKLAMDMLLALKAHTAPLLRFLKTGRHLF